MIHIPHRVPHTTEYLGDNYNWGNRHYRHKCIHAVNGDRYESVNVPNQMKVLCVRLIIDSPLKMFTFGKPKSQQFIYRICNWELGLSFAYDIEIGISYLYYLMW